MELGLALRPGVFDPRESVKISVELAPISHFFIPDVLQAADPIIIAHSILMSRSDCSAGSGVIRLLEHNISYIEKQVRTIQTISNNRFFLGVGTGNVPAGRSDLIKQFLNAVSSLKASINGLKIYVAALKEGMARKAAGISDGIILNFSTFNHARKMTRIFKENGGKLVFSYLKVFVSWNVSAAQRMALDELKKYSSFPHYASLFERENITVKAINDINNKKIKELQEKGVLLVNPSPSEVYDVVSFFVKNGVDVPVIYPYFPLKYSYEEKIEQLKKLITPF